MPDAKNGSDSPIQDKEGTNIDVGDQVFTKFRGGKREGEVSAVPVLEARLSRRGAVSELSCVESRWTTSLRLLKRRSSRMLSTRQRCVDSKVRLLDFHDRTWSGGLWVDMLFVLTRFKVIFNDQHGHRVAHNPETLTVTETEEEKK